MTTSKISFISKMALLIGVYFIGIPAGLLSAQLPSFPGAEGYGKFTTGGRGGVVYEVTNLNDSGAGSLRAAVQASGTRTVVFKVSGTIDLQSKLRISNPNITIAGQTAPGEGIALKRYPLDISADNVIIRHIRARYGDETGNADDAVSSRYTNNLMLDHISASWSLDEAMSIYHGQNTTVQWSMITESLDADNHGFGSISGSNPSTYHHNLIAHHTSRNVRFASGAGNVDYRNNLVYNWSDNSAYGGEAQQVGNPALDFSTINMVANYYKSGPATASGVRDRIVAPSARGEGDEGSWYVAENYVDGYPTVTANNWLGVDGSEYIALDEAWPAMSIAQQTAEEAYLAVLDHAGASLPIRDQVDTRLIGEVSSGNSTYGNNGIITSQNQVGGWPVLSSAPAPADNDQDGMPDDWEVLHGLNPNLATDRNNDFDSDGYTNLEEYLNDIGAFPAVAPLEFNGGTSNRFAQAVNWAFDWQPSRLDTAVINSGTVVVDAVGQHAGKLLVAPQSGQVAALTISSGWLEVADSVEVGSGGGLGSLTLNPAGTIVAPLVVINSQGTLDGSGEIVGSVINDGQISPGTLNFSGDFAQNAGGILTMEIESDSSFDELIVGGVLMAGGTLNIDLLSFSPQAGDSFDLFDFSTSTGAFLLDLPGLANGLIWDVSSLLTTGELSVVESIAVDGDFDGDRDVDGHDFLAWQRDPNIGSLTDWDANYGTPAAANAAAVPEPITSTLTLIVLLRLLSFRQRKISTRKSC